MPLPKHTGSPKNVFGLQHFKVVNPDSKNVRSKVPGFGVCKHCGKCYNLLGGLITSPAAFKHLQREHGIDIPSFAGLQGVPRGMSMAMPTEPKVMRTKQHLPKNPFYHSDKNRFLGAEDQVTKKGKRRNPEADKSTGNSGDLFL